jgi:two-component system, sensor histidine kinase and response regulator
MRRVLIAEDEPALLESFCELVSNLGHECVGAHDGNEALELARTKRPDVVVTDSMMPGRTGPDLIRALRKELGLTSVPVILVSAARPSEADEKAAWRFLSKPLTLDAFENAVREALDAVDQAQPPHSHKAEPDGQVSPEALVREAMLGWVAHEIKSPLSAALMASQLALRGIEHQEEPATLKRRLTIIARQLVRMDELVTSILDAARVEEAKLELDLELVDIVQWVVQITDYWKELHSDYEFPVSNGERLFVEADRERLRQVIDNLISNAIKYGGPSKRIDVGIRSNDSDVFISVSDSGKGIAPSELPHIFDRFHRVAGQGGRGHGLGLYVAAALARLHGGELTVESQVNHGSTFTLRIPRRFAS